MAGRATNRTTTQEGDSATSHEEAEDDYPAQQKNKHQKMDYAEARRIAQEQAGHESRRVSDSTALRYIAVLWGLFTTIRDL